MIPHTASTDSSASVNADTMDLETQDHDLMKVEAAQVYVIMKKNTRVSRNIRACWFFKHLRQSVKFTPPASFENLAEDLTLVSVIPKDPELKLHPGQVYEIFIVPETNVTFLSSQYRLSFTLDLSPSLMSVDVHNGEYIFSGILKSLSRCLRGLVAPVPIPGIDVSYCPDLYISVICHTPVVCSATNQVLVQGVKMNQNNIDYYLRHIEFELNQFEAALSGSFASLLKLYRRKWQQEGIAVEPEEEEDTGEQFNPTDHMGTPEAGFTNMLRYGILALQLLPENSSSGIIVITDGIVGLPNCFEIERLLNQLRNHTVMCSFIKVGSSSGLYRKLCHVPHIELMQAIATATFGAYLGSAPDVTEEPDDVNLYHRAMLFWSFQRGLEGFKYDLTHYSDEDMPGSISWIKRMLHRHPITLESFGIENLRKEREKRLVRAGLHNVLAVRLREGYTLKSIYISQDHREIQVKMHFPWRDYGKIEYTAVATWPLEKDNLVTNIEVAVEGSYDLLHDMLCKPTDIYQRSPLRISNVKTLWTILDRISSTDRILEKLQSFSSQPTYYLTPESIRSGVPLFYMQQDGPSLNMQLQGQGSEIDRFASFWKDVTQLKTSTWQKWLHSHRIGLVLEHDRQFPRYFQVPNVSSRFTSIQCRQALASLSLLLREWSTFVLAENHSYIKFLNIDQDKPPQFFCVLRLTSKAPSMIIRLGFLGGTPAHIRVAEIDVLREKIRNLSFPHRGTQKASGRIPHSTSADSLEEVKKHKSPLSREGSEIACCVLLTKPVEKILVIYESRPSDMQILKESVHFSSSGVSHPPQDPMRSTFRTITHYLQHQRWIWTIQASKKVPVSMSSVSRLLATITKLRLQEGFNIAVSSAGITNLVLEVDMKEHENGDDGVDPPMHTCVVQYIVFPPHTKTIDDSMSEDDQVDPGGMTEADAEVQIVTECWLEPQYGICCNNTPERQHFNGLTYMDIAKAFFPYDYECVSSLSTFEHLAYLCENSSLPSPDILTSLQPSPPSTPSQRRKGKKKEENSIRAESTVNLVPFPFDLQSLLPRSQQAKLLFSTFIIGDVSTVSEDDLLDPKGPNELLLGLFYDKLKEKHSNEILLSADDCFRFLQQVSNRSTNGDKDVGFTRIFSDPEHSPATLEKSPPGTSTKRSSPRSNDSSPNPTMNLASKASKHEEETPQGREGAYKHFHSKYTGQQTSKTGHAGASSSPDNDASGQTGEENPFKSGSGHSPMWKCYIKMEGSDHLLMTFVPSTFEDLMLLNPAPELVPEPGPDTSSQGPDLTEPSVTAESLFGTAVEGDIFIRELPPIVPTLGEKDKGKSDKINPIPEHASDAAARDRENKNEEVQDWVNSSSRCMKPAVSGELQMPVYAYSCQLKNVTSSLIDRWTFQLPEDVVHDFTFKSDMCNGDSPGLREQSYGSDSGLLKQEDEQSRGGSYDRRSTDSTSIAIEGFKEHCLMVADVYSKSFVTGVFLSLQQSYYLDSRDVFAAINDICNRSHPLETDMTTYLLASCSHMQNLIHRARRQEKKAEEAGAGRRRSGDGSNYGGDTDSASERPGFTRQLSVRFQEIDLQKEDEAPKIPETLQLPEQTVELLPEEWNQLMPDDCHLAKEQKELLDTVKAKFHEAFGLCLKQVPSLPDFYFYCPNVGQIDTTNDLDDKALEGAGEDCNGEQAGEMKDDDEKPKVEEENAPSLRDASMESNREVSSLDSFEGNMSTDMNEGCDLLPLFVHFTCTIKQRSNVQHASVRRVPLCLGDLAKSIKEPLKSIDFGEFKVTFDINCLTLSNEPLQRSSFQSLLSNTSQSSTEVESGEGTSQTTNGSAKPIGNPISHLPKTQHSAIYGFKEEIEYLMQEEVISALRHMFPISADTLTFVADYIHNGVDYQIKTARYQVVNMQFVFETDQSLNMFIQEFEHMSLPGYKLTREGDYYFLIIHKTPPINYTEACGHFDVRSNHKDTELSYLQHCNPQFDAEAAMGKEERSSSLPCILPSTDPDKQGMGPGGRPHSAAHAGQSSRPRSSSDGKFLSRPLSAGMGEALQTVARNPLPEGRTKPGDISKLLSQSSIDPSLKKSSSFAGLQRPQVRSPSTNGARSRHCSAPSGHAAGGPGGHSRQSTVPQSPSIMSSRNSTNDDGFDGDISDNEQDESGSVSDISTIYPELPDFWLLMQIHNDKTEVFFHSREPTYSESEVNRQHFDLYCMATENIHKVCRKVNQALLLKELYKTKACTSLLVPEADQDFALPNKRNDSDGSEEDEWDNDLQDNLVASMGAVPAGFFACPVVWQHRFYLHPRLHFSKIGMEPLGLLVLRKALNTFLVQNRSNMFVIQEQRSGNVFYLRLKRTQVPQEQMELDLEASLSDSNQFTKQLSQTSKTDSDTVSLSSSLGRQSGRAEEVVELTVHGIVDVGVDIKEDLVQMLQNKLDDALLDAICVMLSRNPLCKLKRDDVSYIQRPQGEPQAEPKKSLLLTIPGHFSSYLMALMYYLRQNLLQFLHTPNYVDSNPAFQFQEYKSGIPTAIPSDRVYLYVRPQEGGGKGIACISVNLVDGRGEEVKLLGCPHPVKNTGSSMSSPEDFEKFVETTKHERSASDFRPGPTALVQFHIWGCGQIDFTNLCGKLEASVRHALSDIVMEFFMLTVPVCSVPRNLCDMYGAPMSSLPASPTKMPTGESHDKRPTALVRKLSAEPGNRSAHGIFSSFMDMRQSGNAGLTPEVTGAAGKFLDFNQAPGHQSDALSLPRTPMSAHSTGTSSHRLSRQSRLGETSQHSSPSPDSRSLQSVIGKYEAGDKGILHPDLGYLMEPWMSYCHKTGVPSVVKTTLHFQSKFSIDFVVKELQSSINSICNEVTLKTFKLIPSAVPGQPPQGVPFIPCKSSVRDVQMGRLLAGLTAGRGKVGLLGIGRNMYQWQSTVQEHQETTPFFPASVLRGYRVSQKYMPQVPEAESKVQDSKKSRTSEKVFIPRQKFLLLLCCDKKMTLLMYNWSSDLVAQVEKTATRLVQWHNARSHVLDSIIAQKMGLYHHFAFSDLHYSPSQNPFTQSSLEVDYLIKYHAPPRDYQRRSSSLSVKERERSYQYPMKRIIPFDQTYKNLPQAKPLDRLMCNTCHDPVSRHGHQTQDLRLLSKQDKQQQSSLPQQQHPQTRKDVSEERMPVTSVMDPAFQQGMHLTEVKKFIAQEEERNKLYHLYLGWFRTNWKNDANQPILEDYIVQLKRAGRLFHFCATPLIFSASWRQAVVQKTTGRTTKNGAGGERLPADFMNSNPSLYPGPTAPHGNLGGGCPSVSSATTPATPDRSQKMRSRHSSGASNVSAKARLEELPGRKGSGQGDPLNASGKFRGSRTWESSGDDQGEEPEEAWHLELRKCFMQEYQQYLVSELGFIVPNVQPSGGTRRGQQSVGVVNLQKTLTGGIIVMELSFRQEFFCVKMFAVDCSQLRVIVNQQMHLIFVDECDKYKDLIHVHSFAHDFHLRCVQQYLTNPDASNIFPSGFDLDSFLTDFHQIFPYPPSFSRNCLQQDCVTLPDLPFPGHMLYDYMLKQMGVQEMSVVRMADKFALVKHSRLRLPARTKDQGDFHSTRSPRDPDNSAGSNDKDSSPLESYDAGLVIINNSNRTGGAGALEDSMKLMLKYFTVLTRESDCYPMRTLHKALGEIGGKRPLGQAASVGSTSTGLTMGDPCKPVAVKQHIGLRKEHVNYRGYSNIHQRLMYSALLTQSDKGKEKILEMVKISEKKCRRDYLWQRLLISHNETDEGYKRRSDTSDSSESIRSPLSSLEFCELLESVAVSPLNEIDPHLTPLFNICLLLSPVNRSEIRSPLSSLEFCELLESVAVSPLNEIDPQLTPLFNMPISWHQGLFSTLMTKYPEAYRCFQSPDKKTQYILVLNSNNLDMFAMLSLNKEDAKTELCAVMKEPVAGDSMHSPSQPNLPLYSLQTHVEDFVNVCCYHVWTTMLLH